MDRGDTLRARTRRGPAAVGEGVSRADDIASRRWLPRSGTLDLDRARRRSSRHRGLDEPGSKFAPALGGRSSPALGWSLRYSRRSPARRARRLRRCCERALGGTARRRRFAWHRSAGSWSHRFRAAVFADLPASGLRGAVVCTGPFGDIKRYADGRAYCRGTTRGCSWKAKSGAAAQCPALARERRVKVLKDTLDSLCSLSPVCETAGAVTEHDVHGGWVYAIGKGSLADPRACSIGEIDSSSG